MTDFDVVVGAGTFRSTASDAVEFSHAWTTTGVTVETEFSGAHLLHLATAGCVLNDVYREAQRLGVTIDGVRVTASGGFDNRSWRSTGISYRVDVDSPEPLATLERMLNAVDAVAEIPKAIRQGAVVERVTDR